MATRPFKKFYCDRPNIFLIPAPAFKVWMYHYAREGRDRASWPSLPKICAALNMGEDSVLKWRKWLIDNGWLVKTGERDSRGVFKVPVMQVKNGRIPTDTNSGSDGRRRRTTPGSLGNGGESIRTGKFPERPHRKVSGTDVPKVSGVVSPGSIGTEVEPFEVNPVEVKPQPQVDVGTGLGVFSGKAQTVDPFAAMREQIHGGTQ